MSKARGHRQSENLARWKGDLENLPTACRKVRAIVHHAALPYRELGAFVAERRRHDDPSARALELAILTVRPGEVLHARWDEFDLAERLWIVPPERMKAGKEHRVPLSDAALAVLGKQAAIRSNDYVFAGAYGADHVGREPADAGAAASRARWPDCARVQIDVLRLVDRAARSARWH